MKALILGDKYHFHWHVKYYFKTVGDVLKVELKWLFQYLVEVLNQIPKELCFTDDAHLRHVTRIFLNTKKIHEVSQSANVFFGIPKKT